MSKTKKINSRRGGGLAAFLKEEGIYGGVIAQAEKEILASICSKKLPKG